MLLCAGRWWLRVPFVSCLPIRRGGWHGWTARGLLLCIVWALGTRRISQGLAWL